MGVESEPVIRLPGEFMTGTGWVAAEAFLDTGAEVNVIARRFVVEHKLPAFEGPLPTPQYMDSSHGYIYGAHKLHCRFTDSWGRKKFSEHIFYCIDREGPPIVLGLPAMRDNQIRIDIAKRTWRYSIDKHSLSLQDPDDFRSSLIGEVAVFALVISNVFQPNHGGIKVLLSQTSDTDPPSIPPEYADYAEVFSDKEAGRLASHKSTDHAIDTGENEPPYGPLYNLSARELQVLRDYIDEALAKGWIQHSTSSAGAPVLFVPKKDGGLRLCVDYRGLNRVTKKNRHPLPLISETLDRLCGAKVFTKFDLKDAYHRIRIKEGDEWKTAFRTRYGHFEYMVMPFGLANAPATFQAYINKALRGYADIFCVVYLDDILIYSETPELHREHVRKVLERLRQFQLYANLKKCVFSTTQVEFLGFIVSTAGVAMDQRRVTTITEWPTPKTFRDIQVFLGFCNFYRRFIHRYSKIASPLTSLLKGSKDGKKVGPLTWTAGAQEAFDELRDTFTKAPILNHFDPSRRNRMETDASIHAVSGIYSQLLGSLWHPIAFWSRKLIPAETHYETHDLELLAIVAAFKHWRHYLEGAEHPVEVITDHNNLKTFMTVKQLNGRQARWAMALAAFDFVIIHRAGKLNPADAPSRRPDYVEDVHAALDTLLPTLKNKLMALAALFYVGEPVDPTRVLLGECKITDHAIVHSYLQRIRSPQPAIRGSVDEMSPQISSHALFPNLGGTSEMLAKNSRNVAFVLKPVAGIVGCNQFIPRVLAHGLTEHETAFGDETLTVRQLIADLQQRDAFVAEKRAALVKQSRRRRSAGSPTWQFDAQDLLRFEHTLYVPPEESLRAELMKRHHDDMLAGHFGVEKTKELLSRKYFWPGISKSVQEYVASCPVCQRVKVPRHRPYGVMQALPQPHEPWMEITMDFITGLPPSKRGSNVFDSILVVVDRYTKMARYLPTNKTIDASQLAELFWTEIVCKFGTPSGIVTDRGSVFTSSFWSEVCYYAKVKRRLSTAFHPQTDGQTERQNQTLEHYLRV